MQAERLTMLAAPAPGTWAAGVRSHTGLATVLGTWDTQPPHSLHAAQPTHMAAPAQAAPIVVTASGAAVQCPDSQAEKQTEEGKRAASDAEMQSADRDAGGGVPGQNDRLEQQKPSTGAVEDPMQEDLGSRCEISDAMQEQQTVGIGSSTQEQLAAWRAQAHQRWKATSKETVDSTPANPQTPLQSVEGARQLPSAQEGQQGSSSSGAEKAPAGRGPVEAAGQAGKDYECRICYNAMQFAMVRIPPGHLNANCAHDA